MAKKKPRKPKPATIGEQLRQAIQDSEHNCHQIALRAGVDPGMLSRFMTEDMDARRDLRLATAAKIANFLGLELRRQTLR